MLMASATGAVRIVTVDDRLVLTELKRLKSQYTPYIAAIQSASNEFLGPMGFLAYGIVGGRIDASVVNEYVRRAKPDFDNKLAPLGVTVTFSASPATGGLSISWTAAKGAATDSGSYTIQGLAEDFSDDWADALTLAVNRWSRFVNALTPDVADKILKAAQAGYEEFITGGTPTAKQLMAATKHKIRLSSVDRNLFINQIKGAINRYQAGYQGAKAKYAEVFKYVGDALRAATKLTISIFRVL